MMTNDLHQKITALMSSPKATADELRALYDKEHLLLHRIVKTYDQVSRAGCDIPAAK